MPSNAPNLGQCFKSNGSIAIAKKKHSATEMMGISLWRGEKTKSAVTLYLSWQAELNLKIESI